MPDTTENNTPDQMVDDPSSQLFASLADFYRDNGLIAEAIAICQAGLESQPENVEGRLVLAKCLLATKQYSPARAEAVKVLSRHPENSEAKKLLAQADSAVPEAPEPAPARTETAAVPAPPARIKEAAVPAPPETVARMEASVPDPVRLQAPLAREMPASPLPLMGQRTEAQAAPLPVHDDVPARTLEPQAVKAPPTPAERPPKPAAEEATEWQAGFGKIVNDLVLTPQVKACMLVDETGYVVADAVSRTGQSLSEDAAALSANIFKTACQALHKIKLGQLERIVIETGDEKIFLRQAGKMVLMISADSSAKVGLVMVNSKRAAEQAESLAKREPGR